MMIGIIIKVILVALFAFIFFSLGRSLYCLVNDKPGSQRSIHALTWRIGLSIAVFIVLLIAVAMGWVRPHGP